MAKQFILILALVTVFIGCRKNDIDTAKPVSLKITVNYEADQAALLLPKNNVEIKLSNLVSGQSYTAKTDNDGVAVFASIVPGNYTITAGNTILAQQYTNTTGINTTGDVSFGASETFNIVADKELTLTLNAGRIGDLVFKQIYYAGSNTSRGAAFRDQFIEIYNNSNDTIYADSLYIGNSHANHTRVSAGATSFDWSTSTGMPTNIGDPNKDYVYAKFLFMIPGSGKDHPLAPGQSLIIAQTALDHTKPYVDNGGNTQGITDPSLTVDLSSADWETYFVDFLETQANPYRWDIDNPNVRNIKILYVGTGARDYIMDAPGREDFFMFKTSENVSAWKAYPEPSTPSSNNALQVPVKYIIDAVEILTPLETARIPKRLPVALDATGTFVTGGQYSSQSLIRKTAKTLNGRVVLQDTNNSSNDFSTKTKADPSKSAASFLP